MIFKLEKLLRNNCRIKLKIRKSKPILHILTNFRIEMLDERLREKNDDDVKEQQK